MSLSPYAKDAYYDNVVFRSSFNSLPVVDDSKYHHSLSAGSNVSISSSSVSGTGSLNPSASSSNSSVTFPTHSSLDLPAEFTIEFFIRNYKTDSCIFGLGIGPYLFGEAAGTTRMRMANGQTITCAIPLNNSSFIHVAITRDASDVVRTYYGGNLQNSATASGTQSFSGNIIANRASGYSGDFQLDEFRITKGVARYTGSTYTIPTINNVWNVQKNGLYVLNKPTQVNQNVTIRRIGI